MTASLPADGQVNWGDPLNAYISNVVMATLTQQITNLSNHQANSPADPHGDRAFALNLFLPITQNANKPGGFVQLTSQGLLPSSVTPTPDTWHDLRPYGSAFAAAAGRLPPQYRQTDGGVRFTGYLATTATAYNGALAFANALPSAVWPAFPVDLTVAVAVSETAPWSAVTGLMTVGTTGTVTLSGLPDGLAAGTLIGLSGWYPLTASYNLIVS